MKGLKGQVSVFIILGILILVMVGINLYLTYESSEVDFEDYSTDNLAPVELFITQCLDDTARDALLLLGQQGGYIYFDSPRGQAYYQNPSNYLQPLSGGVKVPLWEINGNIIAPSIDDIQNDMKRFIESEIDSCVQTIYDQPSVSAAEFLSTPTASVIVGEDAVSVFLEYDISVTKESRTVEYEKYAVTLDVQLKDILETADFLANRHQRDLIVSELAMSMISLDPEIPIDDIRFSCSPLFWSKRQVTSTLQSHLTYMIPQVRIQGTDHQPFNEPLAVYERFVQRWSPDRVSREGLPDNLPVDMYEYTQQYWQIPDHEFGGLQVALLYDDSYGIDLQVNPSDGDRIEAIPGRSGSSYLRYLCMNIFHFTYDVSFPFEVMISDETALNGDGFRFNYALAAHIDHNYPTASEPRFISVDALDTSTDFCENVRDEESYVVIWDAVSKDPVNNANIRYDCMKYYCDLGKTTTEYGSGLPELRANIPQGCFNGFFIAEKDGYLKVKEQIEDPTRVELHMVPLKEFNFMVANKDTNRPLDTDIFTSMIFISSKEHDFEQYVAYPPVGPLSSTIELVHEPGKYDVEVMVFSENNFVGGYFGELDVSASDLSAASVYFYPYIQLDMVQSATEKEIGNLYQRLDENDPPYRAEHQPEFR